MKKQVSLITGASRGIGRAVAQRLTANGHHVIGLARGAPDSTFPGDFFQVDLADRHAREDVLRQIAERFHVNNVVNNAGVTTSLTLEETTFDELDRLLEVNLHAAVHVVQACLPQMKEAGSGSIVNIASRAVLGMPRRSAYAAAKGGLQAMTRGWALELGRYGITVNTVAPGPVETELYTKNNPMSDSERQQLCQRIPIGRIGRPADIAGAVAFFLSDDARFVTGQTLYVCGGLSVGAAPL